jgi:filamentous hemagglutinin
VTVSGDAMKVVLPDGTSWMGSYAKLTQPPLALLEMPAAESSRIGTTLPGAQAPITVTAEGSIGGRAFFDTNQTARPIEFADPNHLTLVSDLIPEGKPNGTMATAHAEMGLIQQAYEAGLTAGQDMTIIVRGQEVCSYCRRSTNLVAAAQRAGLNSLKILDYEGGQTWTWKSGDTKLVRTKW